MLCHPQRAWWIRLAICLPLLLVLSLSGCVGFLTLPNGLPVLHIYWTTSAGTIGRANLDGTDAITLITGGSGTFGIEVDTNHIYWANNTGTIGRANLDGSGVNQSFISGASGPDDVEVDSAHIYWANAGNGTIGRANLDGSGVDQSFISGISGLGALEVDSGHIYWSRSGGTIGQANLNGTGVITLITGISNLSDVEVGP